MAKKRVTRSRKRQLEEPDKFISFTAKIFGFMVKYKTLLLLMVGVIMLILIAGSYFYYYSDKAEGKASVMLANSLARYDKMNNKHGPVKACQEVANDFNQIIENKWGKDSAKTAMMMYANICYNAGDFDTATKLYNKVLSRFENNLFVKNLILNNIAYSQEGKKDYKTAAKYFEMIMFESDDANKDEFLFNLGRLYAVMGDKDKSIEAFNRIISDYKDSSYLELAKEKIFHSYQADSKMEHLKEGF